MSDSSRSLGETCKIQWDPGSRGHQHLWESDGLQLSVERGMQLSMSGPGQNLLQGRHQTAWSCPAAGLKRIVWPRLFDAVWHQGQLHKHKSTQTTYPVHEISRQDVSSFEVFSMHICYTQHRQPLSCTQCSWPQSCKRTPTQQSPHDKLHPICSRSSRSAALSTSCLRTPLPGETP